MLYMKLHAPELDGGLGWLNTDTPIHLKDLRGKIVLLDFWTFCCINCMHVIPDLKKLEAKYPNELVVIGVHSAKFENEKSSQNIREAILRYGIEHPVVNDADFAIWQAYDVHSWPTLVLIDPDGRLVGQVSGEGNYETLDKTIAKLVDTFDKEGKLNKVPLRLVLEKDKVKASALSFPGKIIADPSTNRLFIADSGHNRIVICDTTGKLLDVIGSGRAGTADGDYSKAEFRHPQGMAVKGDELYIADTENHLLRHVDLKSKTVTTVAGTGKQAAYRATGGTGTNAALSSPWDLCWVGEKLYIAMAGPHQIWDYDIDTQQVAPYAGSGREDIIDGTLKSASLAQPSGITTDGARLYFVDSEVSAVRSCDLKADGQVQTLVGEGLFVFGDKDGVGKQARLQHPLGILWHDGKLWVADSYNHKIKLIDPKSKAVISILGNGEAGFANGDPGQFSEPAGLAAIGHTLYIADTNNNAIRTADIARREVETLNIAGLQPPSPTGDGGFAPGLQTIPAMPISIHPDSGGQLNFSIKLPPGFHLNEEAGITYRIEQQGSSLELSSLSGSVKPPAATFNVPFKSGKDGTSSELTIHISVYYCSDKNSECLIRSLLVTQPVTVTGRSAEKNIQLDLPILNER